MVTRRTGRPRGRPPKPKALPRGVGRPKLALRDDPDRYAIVLVDVLIARRAGTERLCSRSVARFLDGVETAVPVTLPDGRVLTEWLRSAVDTKGGANSGTIRGRGDTLRVKRRRYRSRSDVAWRAAMGAFFQARIDHPKNAELALAAAALAGETEYAQVYLRQFTRLNG